MTQAPDKYISNISWKKTQGAFCLAYFSAYMSFVDALQVPGNLVSNAPPLVDIYTPWRGNSDPIQWQPLHKIHNTAEATVTRAN